MVWAFDWFYADPATAGAAIGATATGLLSKAGAWTSAAGPSFTSPPGSAGWPASSP